MGSFMQSRGYGPQSGGGGGLNNFHSVFGGGNDIGTPPLLDLSEFPSLTNARGNDSMPQQSNSLQPPGSKPYGWCPSMLTTNVSTYFCFYDFQLVW